VLWITVNIATFATTFAVLRPLPVAYISGAEIPRETARPLVLGPVDLLDIAVQ